jgi:hypothetical protein
MQLEKPRGEMGMTWQKGRRVAYAILMVGALAMASGANYWDYFCNWWW